MMTTWGDAPPPPEEEEEEEEGTVMQPDVVVETPEAAAVPPHASRTRRPSIHTWEQRQSEWMNIKPGWPGEHFPHSTPCSSCILP